jgi:hypothetical protein
MISDNCWRMFVQASESCIVNERPGKFNRNYCEKRACDSAVSGNEFLPVAIAFGFQRFFVFVPVDQRIVAPEIIKKVKPTIQYFVGLRVNLYLFATLPHGVGAPATIGGLKFFRSGFEPVGIRSRGKQVMMPLWVN